MCIEILWVSFINFITLFATTIAPLLITFQTYYTTARIIFSSLKSTIWTGLSNSFFHYFIPLLFLISKAITGNQMLLYFFFISHIFDCLMANYARNYSTIIFIFTIKKYFLVIFWRKLIIRTFCALPYFFTLFCIILGH